MNNDEYKKITDLGIQVFRKPLYEGIQLVSADALLEVLNKGIEVKGFCNYKEWSFGEESSKYDTHSGLVIGIKEIKPINLEERILDELSRSELSATQVLENIRYIITDKLGLK